MGLGTKVLITVDLHHKAEGHFIASATRYIVFYSQKESVNQLASTPGSISIVCFGEKTIREFYCFRFNYGPVRHGPYPIVLGGGCLLFAHLFVAMLLSMSMCRKSVCSSFRPRHWVAGWKATRR